jgi:glyoxylase-like metal-dependent hydrolase (beta-lactamase superfamily II)
MDQADTRKSIIVTVMTRVTAQATLVRANNPSPMTLDGTNTWVLAAPGASSSVVVDPGPDDAAHFEAM